MKVLLAVVLISATGIIGASSRALSSDDTSSEIFPDPHFKPPTYHITHPDGSYFFRHESPDGSIRFERGYFVLRSGVQAHIQEGYYTFQKADGKWLSLFYAADENGFFVQSEVTTDTMPQLGGGSFK